MSEPLAARNVAHLFAPLHEELIQLLRGLSVEAWSRPTIAGKWLVRDVAAHLFDGDLRKLASHRDGHLHAPEGTRVDSYADVVALINVLNASGVSWASRLSGRLLTDLLEVSGRWVSEFVESIDPEAPALFPVAWAGEAESKNWMDTGREYTERWHHQMQIRDAVGAPMLLEERWFEPLVFFSVHALPPLYKDVEAAEGASMTLHIEDSAVVWSLVMRDGRWTLQHGPHDHASTQVVLTRDDAWRLFYNAYDRDKARSVLRIEGDHDLAMPLLRARSVMV